MPRILVIDGYDDPGIAFLANAGASPAGELYARLLTGLRPGCEVDIAQISRREPVAVTPGDYDGLCWTGSNMFFSASNAIVQRHIDLCAEAFAAGVPQFGSCWAAQLAAVTAGGEVDANPKGREFGLARKITLSEAGRAHPMYRGKPDVFDGFTSHGDIITRLPDGAQWLAGNAFTPVQALALSYSGGDFWAVQYHPEFDFHEIAGLAHGRRDALIAQGIFHDHDQAGQFVDEMRALDTDPSRTDLAWKYGADDDVMDPCIKTREVQNWLDYFFNE